jgi:hypothetical protein
MSDVSTAASEPEPEQDRTPDELAAAGLAALVARWYLASKRKEVQDAVQAKAKEEADRQMSIIKSCRDACVALGYNPDDKDSWAPVMRTVYPQAKAIFNKSRPAEIPPWGPNTPKVETPEPKTPAAEMPRISDIILSRLAAAGGKGDKAANIRKFIADEYSTEIHEKTVGMTLYRLLKREEVRRTGHTWFIAPKAMNPGAATPGLTQSQEER